MRKWLIGSVALLCIMIATLGATTGISGPKTMWGMISDTVARALRIDAITNVLTTIDHDHSKIHSGSSWICNDVQNINATSMQWLITTPDSTTYAHMLFGALCTGELQINVTEGASRAGVTYLAAQNQNRVADPPTSATVVVYRGVTGGTTDGSVTLLTQRSGATESPVSFRALGEYILRSNTKYVVTLTTYSNVYATLVLNWNEHQDKD